MLGKATVLNVTIISDSLDQAREPALSSGSLHRNRNVVLAGHCPQQQSRLALPGCGKSASKSRVYGRLVK